MNKGYEEVILTKNTNDKHTKDILPHNNKKCKPK